MLHRRAFCKALATAPAAMAAPMLMRSAFADEVSSIVMVSQHGLPYLPLMVMDTLKLVEKHASKLGIAALKPDYKILGGTQSLVDALLSRQMDFGVTGVPCLATLWDKTAGTPNEVRALSAVQSMPFLLVTNRPAIKTLKDFTDQDRIAVPAVKVSSQAICLQMAAAKLWGDDQYAMLDATTVTQAVYAALSEAEDFINKQPGEAAQIYLTTTGDKRGSQEEMIKFISDPDNIWTTTPRQTMTFAGFMHKVGTMKRLPASWKDLYMPECQELAGS